MIHPKDEPLDNPTPHEVRLKYRNDVAEAKCELYEDLTAYHAEMLERSTGLRHLGHAVALGWYFTVGSIYANRIERLESAPESVDE